MRFAVAVVGIPDESGNTSGGEGCAAVEGMGLSIAGRGSTRRNPNAIDPESASWERTTVSNVCESASTISR